MEHARRVHVLMHVGSTDRGFVSWISLLVVSMGNDAEAKRGCLRGGKVPDEGWQSSWEFRLPLAPFVVDDERRTAAVSECSLNRERFAR